MARIKNLTNSLTAAQVGDILNSVTLACDDETLAAAAKVILGELIAQEASEITTSPQKYILVSTHALTELLSTTEVAGIIKKAANSDLTDSIGDAAITVGNYPYLLSKIDADMYQKITPIAIKYSNNPAENGTAMGWDYMYKNTSAWSSGNTRTISPTLPSGLGYSRLRVDIVLETDAGFYQGAINLALPGDNSAIQVTLSTSGIQLYLHTNGLYLAFKSSVALTDVSFSVRVSALVKSV